jgi:hypothetical protein
MQKHPPVSNELVLCSDARLECKHVAESETLSSHNTPILFRSLIASKKTNDDDYVKWHHQSTMILLRNTLMHLLYGLVLCRNGTFIIYFRLYVFSLAPYIT